MVHSVLTLQDFGDKFWAILWLFNYHTGLVGGDVARTEFDKSVNYFSYLSFPGMAVNYLGQSLSVCAELS